MESDFSLVMEIKNKFSISSNNFVLYQTVVLYVILEMIIDTIFSHKDFKNRSKYVFEEAIENKW